MGVSTDAILAYGYDLGDPASREGNPEWYDDDEDGDIDFSEQAMNILLAKLAGFTETDWKVDGYWTRKEEAKESLGFNIITHCSYDYPMYILCIEPHYRAWRGDAVEIPHNLGYTPEWDSKLDQAVEILGLKVAERPSWLLASLWG
jgi:hypothetical protein